MSLLTRTLCLILFCFPVVGFAQQEPTEKPLGEKTIREPMQWPEKYDPRTLQPIRLFMTREEVHEMWGTPEKSQYRVHEPGEEDSTLKEYSPEEYAADVKRYGEISLDDIYYRKTAANRYQIRISYLKYPWNGGAEAELRVESVSFTPSIEVPLLPTLGDFPEVTEVCGPKCWMQGGGISRVASVTVYPRDPADRERLTPRQMGRWNGWYRDNWKEEEEWRKWVFDEYAESGDRVPVLILVFRPQPVHENFTLQDVDWMQRAVFSISFAYSTPHWNLNEDLKHANPQRRQILVLGSYIPQGQK